jgi:hypothetical protein
LAGHQRLAELIFKTLWLGSNPFCFVSASKAKYSHPSALSGGELKLKTE